MPLYEYRCKDCGHTFERAERIEQHQAAHPDCPECGSGNVEQMYSAFFAKTSRKS